LQLPGAVGYNVRIMRAMLCWLLVAGNLCGCSARQGVGAVEQRPGVGGLVGELRVAEGVFALAGRREIGLVYAVQNRSGEVAQLEFPTGQRLEVVLADGRGRRLFLWSEDRWFEEKPSHLLVNPGERLEYEASVPTRDMEAGGSYTLEARLVGYNSTAAQSVLRPR
jgi:hypothetical protein